MTREELTHRRRASGSRKGTRVRLGGSSSAEVRARLDRLVDSILASVRGEGLTGLRREPFDVVASIGSTVGTLALLLRTRPVSC